MKTAIYIEDALLQVVLTPQTDEEKRVLDLIEKKDKAQFYRGSFFETRGGWHRFAEANDAGLYADRRRDDESLIIVLREPAQPTQEGA